MKPTMVRKMLFILKSLCQTFPLAMIVTQTLGMQ